MEIPYLPNETWEQILLNSDLDSLFQACQVNTQIASICRDEGFWRNKYLHDFGRLPPRTPRSYRAAFETLYRERISSPAPIAEGFEMIKSGNLEGLKPYLTEHSPVHAYFQYSLDQDQYTIAKYLFDIYTNRYPQHRYMVWLILEAHYIKLSLIDDPDRFGKFMREFQDKFYSRTALLQKPSINILLNYNFSQKELSTVLYSLLLNILEIPARANVFYGMLNQNNLTFQQALDMLLQDEFTRHSIYTYNSQRIRDALRIYNEFLVSNNMPPEHTRIQIDGLNGPLVIEV